MDQDWEVPGLFNSNILCVGCWVVVVHAALTYQALQQELYKERDVDQSGCMSASEMRMIVEDAGE